MDPVIVTQELVDEFATIPSELIPSGDLGDFLRAAFGTPGNVIFSVDRRDA